MKLLQNNKAFAKIFMWLFVGLAITFSVGYYIQGNEPLINKIFGGGNYFIIWIVEIVVAIVLSVRIRKLNPKIAAILYMIYAALTGLTFSTIFIVYQLESIIFVFLISAIVVFLFGIIGYFTNIDLSKISTLLFMALIALIILSVVSVFINSETFNLGLTFLSLAIFLGYIAYDVQVIKRNLYGVEDEDTLAIYGAFQIYIDFINIFIDLLRLFGKEK